MISISGWSSLSRRTKTSDIIVAVIVVVLIASTFTLGYRARVNRGISQNKVTQATTDLCVYIATLNAFFSETESITRDRMRELPKGGEKAYLIELTRILRQARISAFDVSDSCRKVEG